jgi:hypothetical protein
MKCNRLDTILAASSCQTARSASWRTKVLAVATRIKSRRRQSVPDVDASIFRAGNFVYDCDMIVYDCDMTSLIMRKESSFEGHQQDEYGESTSFDQRTVAAVRLISPRQELAAASIEPFHDLC